MEEKGELFETKKREVTHDEELSRKKLQTDYFDTKTKQMYFSRQHCVAAVFSLKMSDTDGILRGIKYFELLNQARVSW